MAARSAGPAKRGTAARAKRAAPAAAPRSGAAKAARSQARDGRAKPSGRRRATGRTSQTRAAVPVIAGGVWALALFGAVALSSVLTALILIPVAAVATASGVRSVEPRGRTRKSSQKPSFLLLMSLGASAVVPLAALAGPFAALAALVLGGGAVLALVLAAGYAASARPLRAVAPRLVASLAPTVAVTCVIVARHQGSTLALAMVGATLTYDAAAFLMGNARTDLGGPVGIVSGLLSVAVVAVFVAAVMNPPFSGGRPWIVFAGLAVAAPLGVRLCRLVTGGERLPAVRRLDSLSLVAPFWVLAAALLLHR